MSFNDIELQKIKNIIGEYIEKRRPREEIRHQLDISFKVENQDVIIYTIRPQYDDETKKIEIPVIKFTYVKTSQSWKIYWQRASLKWVSYEPAPKFKQLEDCIKILHEDSYGCFWG